jgi:hypothetical protein
MCAYIAFAVARGYLEYLKGVTDKQWTELGVSRIELLNVACRSGHLPIVKWLCDKLKMTPNILRRGRSITSNNYNIASKLFQSACTNGHLTVAQWLCHEGQLTKAIIVADGSYAFRWACANGHLIVAQWLVQTFGLIGLDFKSDPDWSLITTWCTAFTLQYLHVVLGISAEEISNHASSQGTVSWMPAKTPGPPAVRWSRKEHAQ